MSVFAKRLKDARTRAGLSQERLGVLAGIDEMSSSARMNQYEKAKHEPDFSMVARIAKVLDVPESYFYAVDDESAWLQVVFHRLPNEVRQQMLQAIRTMVGACEN